MSRKLLVIAAAAAAISGASMAQLATGGAVVNGTANIGSSVDLQAARQGGIMVEPSVGVTTGIDAQRNSDQRMRDTVRARNEAKGTAHVETKRSRDASLGAGAAANANANASGGGVGMTGKGETGATGATAIR